MPKVLPDYKKEAKKRIIQGALKTFLEKGYQKSKMTDIAEGLGVSKGAIYQYFGSKESLFLDVFDLFIELRREKIIEFLNAEGLEGITSEKFFELNLPNSDTSRVFTLDLLTESLNNETLRRKISKNHEQALQNIERFFVEMKQKNLIKTDVDCRQIAVRLLGMREGLKNLLIYNIPSSEIKKVWVGFTKSLVDEIKNN